MQLQASTFTCAFVPQISTTRTFWTALFLATPHNPFTYLDKILFGNKDGRLSAVRNLCITLLLLLVRNDHIDTTLWHTLFFQTIQCVWLQDINALVVREECHCWHVFGLTMLRGPVELALRASVCCHHFLRIHLKVVSASYKLGSDRFAYFCHLFFLPCNCRHRGFARGA